MVSSGDCTSCSFCQKLGEGIGGTSLSQRLSWPAVQLVLYLAHLFVGHLREVGALREVVADEPVGVLVGPALPGGVWVAEVDPHARLLGEADVRGHLHALVPRERSHEGPRYPLGHLRQPRGDELRSHE